MALPPFPSDYASLIMIINRMNFQTHLTFNYDGFDCLTATIAWKCSSRINNEMWRILNVRRMEMGK